MKTTIEVHEESLERHKKELEKNPSSFFYQGLVKNEEEFIKELKEASNKKKLKILYGIQCTGNGHLTRSKEIIKYLKDNFSNQIETIDVCLSGNFSQVNVDELNVKFKYEGLGFNLDNGKISLIDTLMELELIDFFKSVIDIDLSGYDIIISDFEPIICWAGILRRKKVLGIGNHYKFLSNKKFIKNLSPNYFSNKVMAKLISPVSEYIAFNYIKEDENTYFPIIRDTLKKVKLKEDNFYLVYLSSFSLEEQIDFFSFFPNESFYIFHNKAETSYDVGNIKVRPIDKLAFTEKMLRCKGVITHTGFQTTAECLYLGKKLMVLPIKNQIEQTYNTKILNSIGVISSDKLDLVKISEFLSNDWFVKLNYIDEMEEICCRILKHRS